MMKNPLKRQAPLDALFIPILIGQKSSQNSKHFERERKKNMCVYTLSQTRLWIEHIKSYDDHIEKIKINKYPLMEKWFKNEEKKKYIDLYLKRWRKLACGDLVLDFS